MTRGSLIVIEGLDRTGKTTQTECLIKKFESLNLPIKLYKFPQRDTEIGQLINKYLTNKDFQINDKAAHLLFSANRWELVEQIKSDLNNGINIILDRYVYSGVAYSNAKGLDFHWCLSPDIGLPKPDITIFLKFQNSTGNSDRAGFGDERYEVVEFQEKVRLCFEKFSINEEWNDLFIDNLNIEQVEARIWAFVDKFKHGVDYELKTF